MSWETVKLAEVASFKTGKLNSNAAVTGGVYPFFTCAQETFQIDKYAFDTEAVLLAGNNANGIFPLRHYHGRFNAYQRTYVIETLDAERLNTRFLYFALRPALKRFESESIGATTQYLTKGILDSFKIKVPDLPTQEQIAAILSAYDDLIENNRRRIALLEQAARLLYREWFVHFRFPGHETARFKDGLPEGWVKQQLGEVCATNKNAYKKGKLPNEVRYIDIGSVSTGRIDDASQYLAEDAPGRARRIAEPMDTIWSNVRPNLKAYALVMSPNENDVFSTGFTVLHAETVSPFFLYFTVTTDDFVKHLMNHATGVSYPAVRADDFERAEVLVPTDELMTEFHQFSEPLFQQMTKLTDQNAKLTAARDLFLPRLMDGRIPVSV